jgi:hypothetical protein
MYRKAKTSIAGLTIFIIALGFGLYINMKPKTNPPSNLESSTARQPLDIISPELDVINPELDEIVNVLERLQGYSSDKSVTTTSLDTLMNPEAYDAINTYYRALFDAVDRNLEIGELEKYGITATRDRGYVLDTQSRPFLRPLHEVLKKILSPRYFEFYSDELLEIGISEASLDKLKTYASNNNPNELNQQAQESLINLELERLSNLSLSESDLREEYFNLSTNLNSTNDAIMKKWALELMQIFSEEEKSLIYQHTLSIVGQTTIYPSNLDEALQNFSTAIANY